MSLATLGRRIVKCEKCPRLVAYRQEVARTKRSAFRGEHYWGKPVPGFGDPQARVVAVGLAPGAHGSNRTGRQFTGDASGRFLFPALYRAGFSSSPDSVLRYDGLELHNLYLTAAARCAPPDNRPTPDELADCRPFLQAELVLIKPRVIVCLGRIAFESVLRTLGQSPSRYRFSHGAVHQVGDVTLVCSYHPSQQNTSTGRLTRSMFDRIWKKARSLATNARSVMG